MITLRGCSYEGMNLNGTKRKTMSLRGLTGKQVTVLCDRETIEGRLEFNEDPYLKREGFYVGDFHVVIGNVSRIYWGDCAILLRNPIYEKETRE